MICLYEESREGSVGGKTQREHQNCPLKKGRDVIQHRVRNFKEMRDSANHHL